MDLLKKTTTKMTTDGDNFQLILNPVDIGYGIKFIKDDPFRATGHRFLLASPNLPLKQMVYDHYLKLLTPYRPEVWVMNGKANDDIPHTHIIVLIDLQKQLDTRNVKFFDMDNTHPWIYKIDGKITNAWLVAVKYLTKDSKRQADLLKRLTCSPTVSKLLRPLGKYKDVMLTQTWQHKALDWMVRLNGEGYQASILNIYFTERDPSMTQFWMYMLYHHFQNTLVFPAGLSTQRQAEMKLSDHFKNGGTGELVIVVLNDTDIEKAYVWLGKSSILQSLRTGFDCERRPNGILILSSKPITYGNLDRNGVVLRDVQKHKRHDSDSESDDELGCDSIVKDIKPKRTTALSKSTAKVLADAEKTYAAMSKKPMTMSTVSFINSRMRESSSGGSDFECLAKDMPQWMLDGKDPLLSGPSSSSSSSSSPSS